MYKKIKTIFSMPLSKIIYEIIMCSLALIVSVIILIEFTAAPSSEVLYIFNFIDSVILIIFASDYFIRLIFAKDKIKYIKSNIIELIAIIPLNSFFQAARLARLSRLVKLIKLFRLISFLMLFYKRANRFIKTNNFHYILLITFSTVILGAFAISHVENMNFSNALWWAFVTTSTVGYGDISPTTALGRIIAVILMIIGIGFLGMLTSTISTFFLSRNEDKKLFRNEVIESIKTRLDNFDALNETDIEDICTILKSLKKSS